MRSTRFSITFCLDFMFESDGGIFNYASGLPLRMAVSHGQSVSSSPTLVQAEMSEKRFNGHEILYRQLWCPEDEL